MPIGPKLEEVQVELDPIITKLDISVSALRDALRGADAKTLSDLHAQLVGALNISLSALRDALQGTGGKTLTDVHSALTAQLNITLSALRDAIVGTGPKTLTDVTNAITTVNSTLTSQLNITLAALRDALLGTGGKTLTDLNTGITNVDTKLGNRTSFVTGFITVTTAGTPVQGPDIAVAPGKAVVIAYHPSNTGLIGIGNSSDNAKLATGTPFILSGAGQAISLMVDNVNRIWVDASVSGEKVMYIVET
jgi:hypothetical protein